MTTFWPPPPPTDTHDTLWPLADTVAGTSRAPGSIVISAEMLRFIIGSCATSCWRIDEATTACVDSTSGDWPLTVMFSWSAAIPSFNSKDMLAPISTSRPSRSCALNPVSAARTLYIPGSSAGTEYKPSSLVTVSRTAPVAALVTVIVAPGSTAPGLIDDAAADGRGCLRKQWVAHQDAQRDGDTDSLQHGLGLLHIQRSAGNLRKRACGG